MLEDVGRGRVKQWLQSRQVRAVGQNVLQSSLGLEEYDNTTGSD